MRMNKRFASTVLTGLFVTTCIFSPAEAQEQSLSPKGAWALTKVDRSQEGGKSYCTLSRKYDDGVVLSLARNQAEEYSLAIDFQKDVFAKDKSLKINLQPGPGQIRAYDMMPSSQKAVVIRLGWDTGFFDTLSSSQQMKVKIGEQSYAFAMPEVAKGQSDLKGCMEELQLAAKGSEPAPSKDVLAAAPVAGSNFSAEKAGDKPSIAALKADVAAKEQKVLDNFAKNMRETEPSLNNQEKPVESKVAAAVPVPPQKPKAPELVKRPSSADVAMATELAAVEPASGEGLKKSNAELKQLQSKLKEMTQETEALKKQTATDLTKSSEQVNSLQKRLAEIAEENAALKNKSKTVTPQMQKELNAMADEQKQLEERLLFAEQEKAKLSVQQTEFASREKTLEGRNAELEKSLREAQQSAAAATAAVSTKSSEQLKTLQTKLSQIVAENEKLKVETATIDSIAAQKQALEAKLQAAEKEKATLVPAENLASAEARAKQLADEKAKLEADMKAAQAKKDDEAKLAAAKVGEDMKAMQDRVAAITSENAGLKQKAEGISPEAQKKIDAAEAEKKILQDKLAVAESEALKKKNTPSPETVKQLETLQAEKQALEAKVAAEQSAKKALEEKLATASAAIPPAAGPSGMTPLPDNMVELERLKVENKALSEKLSAAGFATATNSSPDVAFELESIKAEKKLLEDKIAAFESADPKIDTATQSKLGELEIRNKQLEESLRDAQTRITETAVSTEGKASRKITELEMKLEAAQKDNLKIARELEDERTKQEDGKLSLVSGDATMEQAVKRSNEAEREIRRLGQQVEKEKQQCSIQKAEIEQMLFDPAVTEEKQLEKLRSLEAQLEQANTKISQMGGNVKMASALDEISPAAGADMGDATWSSATPPSVVAEPVADNIAGSANRIAAIQQRQLEDLKRQLARKENESTTYRNQMIAAQQRQNIVAENDAVAQRLSGIETSAGSSMMQDPPASKAASKPVQNAAYDKKGIQSLLQKAGLNAGNLNKESSGMPGAENFGWSQGSVKGVASIRDAKSKNFDAQVKEYIAHQKSRCAGDFASMPSPTDTSGKKMEMYEVACVGAQSKSSSIVFFEDKGRFVAIASQTDAADMDTAMDSRDKIASAVKGM